MNRKTYLRTRRKARSKRDLQGTSTRPRFSVYRSLNNIYVQLIDDKEGKTLVSENDLKIKKEKGKGKIDRAFKVGEEVAKKAAEKGIKEVVFDRNGFKYQGRIAAVASGARKGGLKF